MTVSKVYARLESEGVLERNRGKPMTVAAQRRPQVPLARLGSRRSTPRSKRWCWRRGSSSSAPAT